LNREKALLLGENAVSNEVTQAEYKGEKPYWFDIASTKHAKANEIKMATIEVLFDDGTSEMASGPDLKDLIRVK